jgi:enoyl-CoA hydratase
VSALLELGKDERELHYHAVGHLAHAIACSPAPVIFSAPAAVCGTAVGLALHSQCLVVTESTRLSLPGAAHGAVPESLASHHLARLPGHLGRYLVLTGAALTGAELHALGLASHLTESHALARLANIISETRGRSDRRLERMLDMACMRPPAEASWSDDTALAFGAQIDDCFGRATVRDILSALDEGGSEWHAAVAERLRASSPLALELSFAALERAKRSDCWAHTLRADVRLAADCLELADCAAGAQGLDVALERERSLFLDDDESDTPETNEPAPKWQHASLGDVPEQMVASRVEAAGYTRAD